MLIPARPRESAIWATTPGLFGTAARISQTARRPPEQIRALNAWLKSYAAAHGATYLDYYTATADDRGFLRDELSDDGLHPNAKGYGVMRPLAERAIADALKRKK